MTPTSAIGAERGPAGFTLVELLLVLTIISLAAAAVVLSMPDPRPSLTREAERLAARLARAQDAALVENRAYAIEVDAQGYAFAARREGLWTSLDRPPFAPAQWEAGTRPELPSGRPILRHVLDPAGATEPLRLELVRGGAREAVAVGADGGIGVERDADER